MKLQKHHTYQRWGLCGEVRIFTMVALMLVATARPKLSSGMVMHWWMHFQNEGASWCVRINPLFRGYDVGATESSAPMLKPRHTSFAHIMWAGPHSWGCSHVVGRIKTLSAHLQANAATCVQVHKVKFNVAYGILTFEFVHHFGVVCPRAAPRHW